MCNGQITTLKTIQRTIDGHQLKMYLLSLLLYLYQVQVCIRVRVLGTRTVLYHHGVVSNEKNEQLLYSTCMDTSKRQSYRYPTNHTLLFLPTQRTMSWGPFLFPKRISLANDELWLKNQKPTTATAMRFYRGFCFVFVIGGNGNNTSPLNKNRRTWIGPEKSGPIRLPSARVRTTQYNCVTVKSPVVQILPPLPLLTTTTVHV